MRILLLWFSAILRWLQKILPRTLSKEYQMFMNGLQSLNKASRQGFLNSFSGQYLREQNIGVHSTGMRQLGEDSATCISTSEARVFLFRTSLIHQLFILNFLARNVMEAFGDKTEICVNIDSRTDINRWSYLNTFSKDGKMEAQITYTLEQCRI